MIWAMFGLMAVLSVWEAVQEWRDDWRPQGRDLLRGVVMIAFGEFAGVLAVVVAYYLVPWAPAWGPLGEWSWWQFVVGLVVADLGFYWIHRLAHGSRLWRWHAWHHQVQRMNTWATHVGHPLFIAAAVLSRLLPCALLGLSAPVIAAVGMTQVVVSWWGHSNVPYQLRWLSWVVVTPEVHQWHHAPGARVNYGLVFSVWDRWFGTFRLPETRLKRAGVRSPDQYPDEFDVWGQLIRPGTDER